MAAIKDSFIDLERHRKRFEANVAELRKSLQYWQTWEAEYEGLREQIQGLGDEPSAQELEDEGKEFGGVLLNEKEIKGLLNDGRGQRRTSQQILGLLSRRIDYVQENVKAMARRLESANEKLLTANVVSQPEVRNEEGLPITEISEELDDDGNMIASSTTTPGDSTPQLLEALRKAGVKDLPQVNESDIIEPESDSLADQVEKIKLSMEHGSSAANKSRMVDPGISQATDVGHEPVAKEFGKISDDTTSRKKSVSFAEDTKDPAPTFKAVSQSPQRQRRVGSGDAATYRTSTGIPASNLEVINVNDSPDSSITSPIVPHDESPEDADLRRQMLEYNMNEVGAIVAEMDLDDSGSYSSYSEDDEDDRYNSSADEDEDQYGRTTQPVITEKYRKQMQELERKLNARIIENVGPKPDIPLAESHSEDRSLRPDVELEDVPREIKTSRKKGVRFAEELDVSEEPTIAPIKLQPKVMDTPSSGPITGTIVERSTKGVETSDTGPKNQKLSRFKAARSGIAPTIVGSVAPQPMALATQVTKISSAASPSFVDKDRIRQVPEGPQGRTHADVLIERSPRNDGNTAIEPDELDPALLHQEVAVEYHRMRNRMIQMNGGFMRTDEESAQIPATEEDEDGSGGRKMSRFKAARLARQ
ncbi:MAG: hypothetical protein Q9187_006992 [Circinaria calcarea]